MRFSVNDGQLGFILTPRPGRGMFQFQMIIDGQTIGDTEPGMLGSAMKRLGKLYRFDDGSLGRSLEAPTLVLSTLLEDERFHDAAILSLAESLDQWLIAGFIYDKNVVILANRYQDGPLVDPTLSALVEISEYNDLVELIRGYWSKINGVT